MSSSGLELHADRLNELRKVVPRISEDADAKVELSRSLFASCLRCFAKCEGLHLLCLLRLPPQRNSRPKSRLLVPNPANSSKPVSG